MVVNRKPKNIEVMGGYIFWNRVVPFQSGHPVEFFECFSKFWLMVRRFYHTMLAMSDHFIVSSLMPFSVVLWRDEGVLLGFHGKKFQSARPSAEK